jgi:hypothetical protein
MMPLIGRGWESQGRYAYSKIKTVLLHLAQIQILDNIRL